ncbi:Casein kinase II subunit beta [Entamoeba marina]
MSTHHNKEVPGYVAAFVKDKKHKYYAEISKDYIEDSFNLTGLSRKIHHFKEGLMIIQGKKGAWSQEDRKLYEEVAKDLLGMIHARYIVTEEGMSKMKEKYRKKDFGCCSRYYCNNKALLPIGSTDNHGCDTVKLYCPSCKHVYNPPQEFVDIDAADFGTTFAHYFLLTHSKYNHRSSKKQYKPCIFGFSLYDGELADPPLDFFVRKSFTTKHN